MSKIIRTIDSEPTDMYEKESMKRIVEGLSISASCANEMHAREPKKGWDIVRRQLRHLIVQCRKLNETRSLTRQALLDDAARIQSCLDKGSKK